MTWRDVLAAGLLFLLPGGDGRCTQCASHARQNATDGFLCRQGSAGRLRCRLRCWIAVEGRVDGDTADRFRKFLHPLQDRHLPIYFFSPGCGTEQTSAACLKLKQSVWQRCG